MSDYGNPILDSDEAAYTIDDWEFHVTDPSWTASGLSVEHSGCGRLVQAFKTDDWACLGCFTPPPQEVLDVIYLARAGRRDPINHPHFGFYGIMVHTCGQGYGMDLARAGGAKRCDCTGFKLVKN